MGFNLHTSRIRLLLAALSLITITACGNTEETPATPIESSTSAAPQNWLTGTWTTQPQSRHAWDTVFHNNGGDPAFGFELGRGISTTGTVILTFTNITWTESQKSDDDPTITGSRGTYTLDGVKLRLTESGDIYNDYELIRDGDSVRLAWLRQQPPPDPDIAVTKTLFTGFRFHRAG
jgi:hypothetical protein